MLRLFIDVTYLLFNSWISWIFVKFYFFIDNLASEKWRTTIHHQITTKIPKFIDGSTAQPLIIKDSTVTLICVLA